MALTPWEWDEGLFILGVRDFDVARYHPHPPGYPLFILAAKLVHTIVGSEFRSLQVVVIAGAMLLFPAVLLLARELRFPFATAICGATLFVFLPNVWYYGGTAFSDVPSLTIGLFACVFLLRGCRDRRSYLIGAVLTGLAAGFRIQNLLLALVPALIATISRKRIGDALAAGGIIVAIVAVCYGGAALASRTPADYLGAVHVQSEYVRKVDSFHNPDREPLFIIARRFFLYPFDARARLFIMTLLTGLSALVSIVMRRKHVLAAIAVFVPSAIFAWLMLDAAAVSRYSIGYYALFALLTADAFALARRLQPVLVAILVASYITWTWPSLRRAHNESSPPAAALECVANNAGPRDAIYVHASLTPLAAVYLPEERYKICRSREEIGASGWWVSHEPSASPQAINFRWDHNALWRIARQRYFEASVERLMPPAGGLSDRRSSGGGT